MDIPGVFNFFKGHPSFRLLPNRAVIAATTKLLDPEFRDYDDDTNNRHPLTYGSDEGAYWVRDAITTFNNDQTFRFQKDDRGRSKPEFLNLDSGASYGVLSILLQTTLPHTGYTKQAFVVTPTYFLINSCFIDAGFSGKITAIDEIGNGEINIDLLERKLEQFEKDPKDSQGEEALKPIMNPLRKGQKKIYKYVMYCIPTFSNPSGSSYSEETKLKLIDIARKYDMLIITDDVYDMLTFEEPFDELPKPLIRFVQLDRRSNEDPESYGNTVSNATFSKLIAPGLRFGYHETVTDKLAAQLSHGGANTSGGTPSQLNSMIVGTMLLNGSAAKVLSRFREEFANRAEALYESIKKFLPKETMFEMPKGGYFSWLTLPEGYDAREIGKIAYETYGIILANGSDFEVIGDERNWGARSIRMSISFLEVDAISSGIELLGKVCQEYASKKGIEF